MKYIDNRLNAKIVKLEDANNNFVNDNVEDALNEIDSKIKNIETDGYDDTQLRQSINNIKDEIGSTALNTINKTIKGAVNEVDSKIEEIINDDNRSKITAYSSDKIENIKENLDSKIKNIKNLTPMNILFLGAKKRWK